MQNNVSLTLKEHSAEERTEQKQIDFHKLVEITEHLFTHLG